MVKRQTGSGVPGAEGVRGQEIGGAASCLTSHGMEGEFLKYSSLVPQMVKNLPAMQETRVQSLGWEDPLEKGVTLHSRVLAWSIPWTVEPGRLQSMESQESHTTEQLTLLLS